MPNTTLFVNALRELNDFMKENNIRWENVVCLEIKHNFPKDKHKKEWEAKVLCYLPKQRTKEDFKIFLNKLKNYYYPIGIKRQQLFGTIWLNNNTCVERYYSNGSEEWKIKTNLDVPSNLETITKKYGVDFTSRGGALTLDPYVVFDPESGENYNDYVNKEKASSRTHDNSWTVSGEINEDYYEWVNQFEASHPTLGRVWGDFEDTVYATSEEGYQDFYKNFPPTEWDYDDI